MLEDIIDRVEGDERTLTLYNVDVTDDVLREIAAFFEPQRVSLRRASTDDGLPRNFAVLHDGEQFLAAADVVDLGRYLAACTGLHTVSIDEIDYPDILRHVDDSTFTDYGKRRMVIASREVEKRAWRNQAGELHAGFQQLSIVETQADLYRRLGESALDVHVYGQPDREPCDDVPYTVHADERPEIGQSWFVVYDGNGADAEKAALLATEVGEDVFNGFWTYDPAIVDAIHGYLTRTYPA